MSAATGRRLQRRRWPALFSILLWTAAFAVVTDLQLYRSPVALQNPYARPERAAVLRVFNETGPASYNVLFVGDSRAGNAFCPASVEEEGRRLGVRLRAFNLAGPASTVPSDAGVLDYALGRSCQPALVIWGLGKRQASLLDFSGYQRNEVTLPLALDLCARAPSWHNLCTLGFCATGGIRRVLETPLEALPEYREQLQAARRIHGIGWAPGTDDWSRRYNAGKMPQAPRTEAQWQRELQRLQREKNAITPFAANRTVERALQFALARVTDCGGRTVLVNMPMLRARTQLERRYGYDEYLRWLQRRGSASGVPVVDLNAPPLLPADEAFADTDHLGAAGARALSQRLTRDLIAPAVRRAALSPRGQHAARTEAVAGAIVAAESGRRSVPPTRDVPSTRGGGTRDRTAQVAAGDAR